MTSIRIRYLAAAIASFVPACVCGFETDGFRSGMTQRELIVEAQRRGLEAREFPGIPGSWAIGNFDQKRIDATFWLCSAGLESYTRTIDFDVDFVPNLQAMNARYGQPTAVTTTSQPWSGPGGGDVRTVEITWRSGSDKVMLSFSPEGRNGQGQLRHNRHASISYRDDKVCAPRPK